MSTFSYNVATDGSTPVLSKTSSSAQLRKIKKPLIERRRRERINECLVQLKTLVLEAMNKDESRYSKMEKADILEMTVTHLKAVQQRVTSTTTTTATDTKFSRADHRKSLGRYLVGFSECANEVSNYLKNSNQHQLNDVRVNLMTHLERMVPDVLQSETKNNFAPIGSSPHRAKSEDTGCASETLSERSGSVSCDGNVFESKLPSSQRLSPAKSSVACTDSSTDYHRYTSARATGEFHDVKHNYKQTVTTDSNCAPLQSISGLRQQQDSPNSSHSSLKKILVSNTTTCFPDDRFPGARGIPMVRMECFEFANKECRSLTFSTNEIITSTRYQSVSQAPKYNDVTVGDVWRPW